MSDADTTHATHGDEYDDGRGGGHGHASAGEPLGPIDLIAWGYAFAGAVLGALVVLALFIARG
jgi:hypothetical protein